ncbi:ATP-binding protein [Maricaulis sp. CAU 1757]
MDRNPLQAHSTIRIRRRDTAAVAVLGCLVVLFFWIFGELAFLPTLVAIATISALSTLYYLTVSTTLRPGSAARSVSATTTASAVDPHDRMLESLPVPILLIGQSGRIEFANPEAREFLGLAEASGHLSAVLRQPEVLDAVGRALRGGKAETVEYEVTIPFESYVRAFVAPLDQASEGPGHHNEAMLVLFDETSVKRVDRMRADFLANASHELRTPLASLAGFIETLRGHAKDDTVARERFLDIMFDQTERMRRLIDDLLSLSRVELNEHVPPSQTTDLVQMVRDAVDLMHPLAGDRSVTIETDLPGNACVRGDRDQLTEVILNLLENAIKYSSADATITIGLETGLTRSAVERPKSRLDDGAARLTLAMPATEGGENFALLWVKDHGRGIERRDLPRLSERFFRVDGQKSGPKEGTGLGLAIVKHIVNRHRGGLLVESLPGQGSVFSVFLPMAQAGRQAVESGDAPAVT